MVHRDKLPILPPNLKSNRLTHKPWDYLLYIPHPVRHANGVYSYGAHPLNLPHFKGKEEVSVSVKRPWGLLSQCGLFKIRQPLFMRRGESFLRDEASLSFL